MNLGVWNCSKRRIKFLVDLHLEGLTSVPFLSGVMFAKLRLFHGGNFKKFSQKEEIVDNCVCWDTHFEFQCKLTAPLSTGILDSCGCRVSIRREAEGGKSYRKLGFADINLAEFAGGTAQSRSYLLEKYEASARANNSLLRVTIRMRVKKGDFCFKVPAPSTQIYFTEMYPELENIDMCEPTTEKESMQRQLSRQSSSSNSGVVRYARSSSTEYGSLERNSAVPTPVGSSRVDSTRVDPEHLVDQLLRESNLESNTREEGRLSLLIGKDGSAAVIGR